MQPSDLHYFPLAWPFLLLLLVLLVVVIVLAEVGVLAYAYSRLGIRPRYVFLILLLSLLGSYVNIPVAQLPSETVVSHAVVDYFGVEYVIPTVRQWPGTIIAINVGGALIPTLLSLYLVFKSGMYFRSVIAVTVVAIVVYMLAKPIPGLGISVPIFVPPLLAAAVAILLAWRKAPPLAFIAGSLGTLIGADILNLGRIQGLGAPVASIGGAGTFDGVFVSGIIAVLLPPLGPAPAPPPPPVQDGDPYDNLPPPP